MSDRPGCSELAWAGLIWGSFFAVGVLVGYFFLPDRESETQLNALADRREALRRLERAEEELGAAKDLVRLPVHDRAKLVEEACPDLKDEVVGVVARDIADEVVRRVSWEIATSSVRCP